MDKEKKEIGKLLELLNEYDGDVLEYGFVDGDIRRKVKDFDDERNTWKSVVRYTKQFGFIKWLVENDKIRDDGIKPRKDLVKEITIVDYKTGEALGWENKYTEVEQLLMYLSIQDEPIRFLCEILK